MPTLTLLLVAVTALTRAAALPGAVKMRETKEVNNVVKRGLFCSSGWTLYKWRCFRFIPTPVTWSTAERNCRSMNAHLASVRSAQEYHQIQRMIADQTHNYPETWIGGSDHGHGNGWRWTDNTPFLFTYWCQGEPNNPGWQNCLQMNYSGRKCWDNLQCNQHRPFMCVKSWSLFG